MSMENALRHMVRVALVAPIWALGACQDEPVPAYPTIDWITPTPVEVVLSQPDPPPTPTTAPTEEIAPESPQDAFFEAVTPETEAEPTYAIPDGSLGCPKLISDALGRAGCLISYCESQWNPNATGLEGEMGWFQIHPRWHPDATYDPAGNVAAAVRISRGGTDWSLWTTASVLTTGVCPKSGLVPPV